MDHMADLTRAAMMFCAAYLFAGLAELRIQPRISVYWFSLAGVALLVAAVSWML